MKAFFLGSSLVFSLLLLSPFSYAQSEEYQFTKAYIKGLGYRYELEVKAETDLAKAGRDVSKMNIASMESAQRGIIKLREAINILIPYKNAKREEIRKAAESIVTCYTGMIDNYNNSLSILEELINATSSNAPNIDIGKLSRTTTEITAKQDYLSETLLKLATLVAMLLIDQVPDENNHVSFLLITSSERRDLSNELESFFSKSLLKQSKHNPKYTVASAIILNKILNDDHKSRDQRVKKKI